MEDKQIIQLFCERDEKAISAASKKYWKYCETITYRIIGSRDDAEECVNDTLLDVWNSIPPNNPQNLGTYMGKIARNNALDVVKRSNRMKRGGKEAEILDELSEFSSDYYVEAIAQQHEIISVINDYLISLSEKKRNVFVLRYWYSCEVSEISDITRLSEANVYKILNRERKKLLEYLKKRGVME